MQPVVLSLRVNQSILKYEKRFYFLHLIAIAFGAHVEHDEELVPQAAALRAPHLAERRHRLRTLEHLPLYTCKICTLQRRELC